MTGVGKRREDKEMLPCVIVFRIDLSSFCYIRALACSVTRRRCLSASVTGSAPVSSNIPVLARYGRYVLASVQAQVYSA